MQGAQKLYDTTLANISRWKCGFGAIAALALGSAPPLIGGRPMHHGFYSTPVGVAIALSSCEAEKRSSEGVVATNKVLNAYFTALTDAG